LYGEWITNKQNEGNIRKRISIQQSSYSTAVIQRGTFIECSLKEKGMLSSQHGEFSKQISD